VTSVAASWEVEPAEEQPRSHGSPPNDLPLSELPILEMFLDGNIGNVTQRQTREHRDFVEFC
jgi:hypothetical protein